VSWGLCLFEEVEDVPQSLQLLTAKELKSYLEMSSHRNSAATGTNYWDGKVVEAVVADEGNTIIDDLKVGKTGAVQNTNNSLSLSLNRNRILGPGWIQGVCADILSHT
jgi:hypothetical protein